MPRRSSAELVDACPCATLIQEGFLDGTGASIKENSSTDGAKHLIVVLHGLHGSPHHLGYLAKRLLSACTRCAGERRRAVRALVRERNGYRGKEHNDDGDAGSSGVGWASVGAPPGVLVLRASCNVGVLSSVLTTADGVDRGGHRVAAEVERALARYPSVTHYSLVGHSLGGLYARFAAARLQEKFAGVDTAPRPLVLMTLATPHVGVRGRLPIYAVAALRMGLVGRTGSQLLLEDGVDDAAGAHKVQPLLVRMADPHGPFVEALSRFTARIAAAVVSDDDKVPYYSASIAGEQEEHVARTSGYICNASFPSVKNVFAVATEGQLQHCHGTGGALPPRPRERTYPEGSLEGRMIRGLRKLRWTNVDVEFSSTRFLSHEHIAQANPLAPVLFPRSGQDAVAFVARELLASSAPRSRL